jgi:dihydrofolate reductase
LRKIIISAVAKNGVIGRSNGEMPWHSKEEFQHFKSTTFGFPIIMGRKTFEALGKPLKGRVNIILTKSKDLNYSFDEVKIFHSLDEAYSFCDKQKTEKAFVIGGAEIYKLAMNTVDEMLISMMDFEAEGDVFFPEIDNSKWKVESTDKRNGFEIFRYVRKNNE